METLPLPPTSKPPLTPSLQFRPLPLPHPPTSCSHVVDSSLPLPSHPPLLNTYPLSAFTLHSTPPPPTSTQPINNSPPHPQRTPQPPKTLDFYNRMPSVFPPHVVLNQSSFFPTISITSFSSKKSIFRQPRSFKSLDNLLSVQIKHSEDRALFPTEVITPVVVSSLLSTLTWPSLLFLSPLFLPRTPTQTTSVLKFFFPTTPPYNSLTSTPLPSKALLLILAPGPSLLTSFQTPLTFLSLETLMLTS